MFVNINHNAAVPMTKLPGNVPAKEVEEVKHEEHKVGADTLVHAAEDAKTEEVKMEEAPKAPAHKGH